MAGALSAIKIYWKQFEESVTVFENNYNPFFYNLGRLMVGYVIVSGVVLLALNSFLHYYRASIIEQKVVAYFGDAPLTKALVTDVLSDLQYMTWVVSVVIIVIACLVTFFMLAKSLKPLREVMHMQKRFITNAAHELRTPLSIMKTNSEVALFDPEHLAPGEVVEILRGNIAEIDRMSRAIDAMLELASFYDEEIRMEFSQVHFDTIVQRSIVALAPSAYEKNIYLDVVRLDQVVVWGNVHMLQKMVTNLIKNAIIFSPKEGLVVITLKNSDNITELVVQDTGSGIGADDLQHVFDPFYRSALSRANSFDYQGAGLGLTIAKGIIDRHSGKITLASEEGRGTKVVVNLNSLHN